MCLQVTTGLPSVLLSSCMCLLQVQEGIKRWSSTGGGITTSQAELRCDNPLEGCIFAATAGVAKSDSITGHSLCST